MHGRYCPPSAPCGYWVDMANCPMETGCGGVTTLETAWTCRHGTISDNDVTTEVAEKHLRIRRNDCQDALKASKYR